jgi:hypothetical protein
MKNLNSVKAKEGLLLIGGTILFFGIVAIVAVLAL